MVRRPRRLIVDGKHYADCAVRNRCIWCSSEQVVHGSAFVGFDMAEADPPQPVDRHDLPNGGGHQWEHPTRAAVEQHRLIGDDEELVEGEPGRRSDVRDEGGEPENPRRDFVAGGFHAPILASRNERVQLNYATRSRRAADCSRPTPQHRHRRKICWCSGCGN